MARPRKDLTPEQIAQIEKLAPVMTQEQIADFFGLGGRTFRQRITDNAQVSASYKKGKAAAIAGVVQNLLKACAKGNVTAMIFYLKCQAGWRETDPKQVDISDISKLSDKELEREKKRLGLVR
jgi:hypothetical protein